MIRCARLMSTTHNTKKGTGDKEDNEHFFCYPRDRFLWDEPHQLSQRYIRFNIDELASLAVRAAGAVGNGPRRCVDIEKLPDGMHNKAVRFTMDDGFQAVGKVPNPNVGLPHFTTASEVATMDFMRNVLGTPVPKVFFWSSTTDNAVGAEYILMENVRGVQLNSAPSAEYTDRNGQHVVDDRFAVGSSMSRQNIDDGRAEFDFDRGPWHTAEDYEQATGLRESYCIRNIPQLPRSPIAIHYSGTYQPSREKKLLAAESYLKLVKYLILDDESTRTSHIWHDDLHTENIFVNPDDPSEIYERPRFKDIRALFQDNLSQWQPARLTMFTKMSLVALYRYFVHKKRMRLLKTLEYQQTLSFQLLLFARNLLLDGEATYLAILADQQQENWAEIPKISHCKEGRPLSFPKDMLEEFERDNEDATASIMLMQEAKQMIGKQYFQGRGVVSHEQFAKAREIIPRVKEEFIQKYARDNEEVCELDRAWPFH
ncbi:hypothetical protein CFD26_101813 [Aspergillus turcosus]|uniref:Altered inheritance of mitochondria protein 9, mitochondrial n=1 Tax=Aspergillus turcosus TaxID=1245748 RepID=A0A421CUE2_9EURO|nr:hypothetical protein CFD26_101813 [Aspergillus turcosus]